MSDWLVTDPAMLELDSSVQVDRMLHVVLSRVDFPEPQPRIERLIPQAIAKAWDMIKKQDRENQFSNIAAACQGLADVAKTHIHQIGSLAEIARSHNGRLMSMMVALILMTTALILLTNALQKPREP